MPLVRGLLASLLLWHSVSAAEIPVTGFELPDFSMIDQRVSELMTSRDIGAGIVSIGYKGNVVYERHFGWRDRDRSQPLNDNTVMRLASLSKVFTAVAVRRLVEQGLIYERSRVFAHDGQPGLLNIAPHSTPDPRIVNISVEDLLMHTSGWDPTVTAYYDPTLQEAHIADELGVSAPLQPVQLIGWLMSQPLQYDPGQPDAYTGIADSHVYNNVNYAIAGFLVEQISGKPLNDYLHDEVFSALGLELTDFFAGRTFIDNQDPREPWYESTEDAPGVLAENLFYPALSSSRFVERPYGSWSQENRIAQGGIVAGSRALHSLLYHFMVGYSRQRVDLQIGRSRVESENSWEQSHTGSITGSNTLGWQRSDGVTLAVLFNRRPADSTLTYTDELFSILEPWLDNADTRSWDDVDRDGITNDLDEFPRSAAAAEDFDGDGLPDSFLEGCDETCIADSGLVLDTDSDNDGTPNSADPDVYNPQVPFLPASARRVYDGGGAAAPLSVLLIPLLTVAGRRKTVSMANDNELP